MKIKICSFILKEKTMAQILITMKLHACAVNTFSATFPSHCCSLSEMLKQSRRIKSIIKIKNYNALAVTNIKSGLLNVALAESPSDWAAG